LPLPKISATIFTTVLPTNQAKVSFRAMQAREDRMLLQLKVSEPTDSEILTTLAQVVQACVLDEKFVAIEHPVVDIEWLFLQIRSKSVSDIANVSYVDRSDNKTYDFEIPLAKVTSVVPNANNLIKVDDTIVFEMKWPTVADTIAVADLPPVDVAHQLGARSIARVYDGDDVSETKDVPHEEVEEFINSLPLKAYQEVMDYLAQTPQLNYEIKYVNSKQESREIRLTTLNDFFTFA